MDQNMLLNIKFRIIGVLWENCKRVFLVLYNFDVSYLKCCILSLTGPNPNDIV